MVFEPVYKTKTIFILNVGDNFDVYRAHSVETVENIRRLVVYSYECFLAAVSERRDMWKVLDE